MVVAALPVSAQGTREPAQGAADPWAGVEEMVVTGAGTAGLLADVTTSAIAFDSTELEEVGAQDISDLARFTPSLEIKTTSATTPVFFIRGVGLNDANANAAGAIAIYVDGVPINSAAIQLTSLFDTESVEVLRGPQAFIDGRNASGGLISTASKKPDGEFSASLRADYGNFGYYDLEGALGVPIVGDELAARFAFRRTYRDGLIRNRCGGLNVPDTTNVCNEAGTLGGGLIPQGLPNHTNNADRVAWRSQIRFAPEDAPAEMVWLLNFHHARIDQAPTLGQMIGTGSTSTTNVLRYNDPSIDKRFRRNLGRVPDSVAPRDRRAYAARRTLEQVTRNIDRANPFVNDYDFDGFERLTQLGGFLSGDMQLGQLSVTTVTGIEQWDRESDTDFDFSSTPMAHLVRADDAIQFTENLGLEYEMVDVPLTLRGGAYALVEKLDSDRGFALRVTSTDQRNLTQTFTQDLFSWGLFGSLEWRPFEEFTIEAGARANWERKDFDLEVARILPNPNLPPSRNFSRATRTWSAPTYGVNFTYHMTEDINAFWKYTRGWKSGHFNASVITLQGLDNPVIPTNVAQPETIDSLEIGFDATLFGGAFWLRSSAFYYRYDNYQVFLLQSQDGSAPQLEIINANSAQIFGIETDLKLRPLDFFPVIPEPARNLTISANFAWLNSEFLDFSTNRFVTLPSNPLIPSPQVNIANKTIDFTGNVLPNTPEFKLSATVEYAFDIGRLGVLTPRYDVTWTDDIFFDPSQGVGQPPQRTASRGVLPQYAIGQRAYALHDVRLTWTTPTGTVTVAGWIRNVTNEVYKENVRDLSTAFNYIANFIGDPRTYGVSASLKF